MDALVALRVAWDTLASELDAARAPDGSVLDMRRLHGSDAEQIHHAVDALVEGLVEVLTDHVMPCCGAGDPDAVRRHGKAARNELRNAMRAAGRFPGSPPPEAAPESTEED